jgi:transcriptional regulator with XRE-family HTH domain
MQSLVSSEPVSTARDHRLLLGQTIRKHRKRRELTLEDLAERAELHPNYLGRVERGEEHVSLSALVRIAQALNCRVHDLVSEF